AGERVCAPPGAVTDMTRHSTPESIFVAAFMVALVAFVLAGLLEIGRRIEKRTGPDVVDPLRRASPGAMVLQGLALYMNQPGRRARSRNVLLVVGGLAVVVCFVAVLFGVHNHGR
ncbi:MAG TPA: hypothetical protein VG650_05810, partial [Mycobacteriales bacterium]|nr:hypothetical protein [Mycobacteriales bacterium]